MPATVAELAAAVKVEGVAEATAGLASVGAAVDQVAQKQDSNSKKSAAHDAALRKVGTGAVVAGGLLVAGFGAAVAVTANFDKAMSGVGAVADATSGEMDKLRDAAIDAGRATAFSATEAAVAEAELAKAGLSVSQILGGALRGALDLAAAGQLELGEAATITAQALNVFKLDGGQASHVADVLAAGANKSAADVRQLGDALRQGGLMARQTGLSLEDTVGALALFADNALIGSDAGTSLKTMLQRLTPTSNEARDEMERLGISAYDAQGNFIGLDKFAGNLRSSLKDLSPEARNAALSVIFGSDAVRAASLIYDAGEGGVRKYIRAVDDNGAAARMAGEQMDNLSGDVEELKGSLETALISGGSAATGILRGLAQGATDAVNAFSGLPPGVQGAAIALAGLTGAGLLAVGVGIKLHDTFSKVKVIVDDFTLLSTAATRFGPAMLGAAGALGAFGAAFAGVAAISWGIVELFDLGASSLSAWEKQGNQWAKSSVEDANKSENAYRSLKQEHAAYGAVLDLATNRLKTHGSEINARTADLSALEGELINVGMSEARHREMILSNRQAYDQTGEALRKMKPAFEEAKKQQQEASNAAEATAAKYGIVLPQSFSVAEKGAENFGKAIEASNRQFGTATTQAAVNAGIVGDSLMGIAKHAAQMDQATATSIGNFTSLVGQFGQAAQVGEGEILDFVTKTTAATQQWAFDMVQLSAAGVDNGLLDQLRQAGPKSQALVTTLLGMVRDGTIGAVNESYAAVRDITGQLNAALDDAAIATQIRVMQEMTVAKAAYADLQAGGTANLEALRSSSDANIAAAAEKFIGHIREMQGGVDSLHGKDVELNAINNISPAVAAALWDLSRLDGRTATAVLNTIYTTTGQPDAAYTVFQGGAHGLVGLARGGVAGQIVGPRQPVVIGEGLSREAVVPFDHFGDMVATIKNTGKANAFAAAAVAAGGKSPDGTPGYMKNFDVGLAMALQGGWAGSATSSQQLVTQLEAQMKDATIRAAAAGIFGGDAMAWELQAQQLAVRIKELQATIAKPPDVGILPVPETPPPSTEPTKVDAEIDWQPVLDALQAIDDGTAGDDKIVDTLNRNFYALIVAIQQAANAAPAATIGSL